MAIRGARIFLGVWGPGFSVYGPGCLSRRHCCHGKHYKAISPHRHIKFFLAIFNYQIKLIKDKKIYERKLAVKELKEGMAQKSC